ncbi:STAS domain-containing protein [Streptomyces paradoxus]|uniref:STAS domain-containing protein n=1 Tax=Streptomyces paradoxus TaxID=66375 RepID=UPI003CD0624F
MRAPGRRRGSRARRPDDHHRSQQRLSVITVSGEIYHHTGGPLREALSPPDGEAVPQIVVDLSGVTFMDSSGINILIAAYTAARDAGGWLRLAGPT